MYVNSIYFYFEIDYILQIVYLKGNVEAFFLTGKKNVEKKE